jgi:hypothetical protein
MARFPRTVTLVEAFRRILRGMGQPALADKIPTRSGWELPYPEDDITRSKRVRKLIRAKQETAKKEMAKLKEARELFGGLVARKKLGLRGTLDPRKPLEDIDPADAEVGVVDILAGELRVFLNGKLARIYRQVRCYETEVRRCVTGLHSGTNPNDVPLPKPLRNFAKKYKGRRTLKDFTAAAEAAGINVTRERLNAALNTLGPRRRGRPLKSQEK